MRIVTLVVLFTAAFYYFIPRDHTGPEIDILKVKVSAPDLSEDATPRLLTAAVLPPAKDLVPKEEAPPAGEVSELAPAADAVEEGEIEHYDDEEEAGVTDLEDGWN